MLMRTLLELVLHVPLPHIHSVMYSTSAQSLAMMSLKVFL